MRSLTLDGGDDESAAETLAALGRGKHWTGLRRLVLEEFGYDTDSEDVGAAAARLLRRPVCAGLRELVAANCNLDDAAARDRVRRHARTPLP